MPPDVETNLIWVYVEPEMGSVKEVAARLKQQGVLVHASGPKFRACTHLDVSASQAQRAAETIRSALASLHHRAFSRDSQTSAVPLSAATRG